MKQEKKNLCIKTLLFAFLFVVISLSGQNTYYISNTGNDSNNGISESTAWRTISKVNAQTFNPGDSILFKCEDRFFGYLQIDDSGNSLNYITYSCYGSGDKPKLYGSKAVTTFTPHSAYSNVYFADTMVINPNDYDDFSYNGSIYFILNDTVFWGDGLDDYVTGLEDLNRNYHWTWQNDSLFFYYSGDINDIDAIECTQLARGIDINGEYIILDGLCMRYFGSRCVGHPTQPEVTKQGLIIRNGEFAYTGSKDQGVGFGLSLIHSDALIEKNKIHANGRRNISLYIQNYGSDAIIRDVIIQNNEIYDGYHAHIDMAIHGNQAQMKNIIIRNNKIWEWSGFDKPANYESNFVNMINNGESDNYDSIFIYNNEMRNFKGSAFFIMDVKNLYVLNNSITASQFDMAAFFYIPNGEQGNTVIMNNIMQNHTDNGAFINGSPTLIPEYKFDTINFNLYHNRASRCYLMENNPRDAGANYRYNEWNSYISHGYEANGIYDILPHFIDSLSNLRLKSTSHAIGAAKPISFITTDIEGNSRHKFTPTIGAYEFMCIDSSLTEIYTFSIPNHLSSSINKSNFTVNVIMPYGTNLTDLTPNIVLSEGATVNPGSGSAIDFNTPVTYTVTSLNKKEEQEWIVTVITEKEDYNNIQNSFNTEFNIFPNPSNGEVYVKVEKESTLSVMDISGAILYKQLVLPGDSRIDFNFQAGIYFIQNRNKYSVANIKKLIVQ